MTREEAIKGLTALSEVRRKYGDMQTMKDEIECLEMAIKALEQRWIPVSERLPEDGRPVLIYAWNVHHVVARYDSFRTKGGYKNVG